VPIAERLDATIQRAISDNRIVGAVVIAKQRGQVIYENALGLADRETERPMALDTVFRLSSLTKPIVATAALALVDAGLLELDAPVSQYLPYFRPKLANGEEAVITIRHLLTHTSGLGREYAPTENDLAEPNFQAVGGNRWHLSLDENMELLARGPLPFAPGTGWAYGQSTDLLGAAMARVAGATLAEVVKRYVTGPLGMSDTVFLLPQGEPRLAAAYADNPEHGEPPVLMGDPHSVPNPAGTLTTYSPGRIFDAKAYHSGGSGMAGTAPDFMVLLEALRTGGGGVIKGETTAAGLGNQTPQLEQASGPGWQFGYFGAYLVDPIAADSPCAVGTMRWGGIYGHSWFIDPAAGLSVVAMTNTGLEGSDGIFPLDIRDAIYWPT